MKVEFGKEEFELLIQLKNESLNFDSFREGAELRIKSLEDKIIVQQKIIDNMVFAASKVSLLAGGIFGGLIYIGYWLQDAVHFKAVTAFFKTLRGE